ncbi:hypothetical protein PtrSN002B_003244 [Pyrenophora tritici-repentis]|uniref:Uncharacterized protein n=2 Tax=Pyrenophora tritici-repentis TaxID=45151 RepID=A0A2W1F8Z1_9PLEO|nr:uncharacterized protein PTRG_08368 [Pyrenophora tritici-repentis Pt-1C-BFP]KAF7443731.1 hypothetical protein A1F99_118050 [Pyrenophora tritici-repentis]EDU51287.1 predicted protein [Pyrenophora tritici-repentis Pt-1C-BFP]KAF7566546.1 hypothetical protein PtrM4_148660 [Pyrenophora tritici-repentis]KAG9379468.1 hypothetical protein A1F94_009824 [Pyrenophora tritici-repentis]KAI0581284.1 hypothetical protein Alg215_04788 [Pyrenophora tritici-repentis]
MVLRLFAPPGEGQHRLVPRRPDPIGANATLQYAVISSTVLAAAYTSLASRFSQRVAPAHALSRTALFIRSSARFGAVVGAAGAVANWYYYSAFANVVVSQKLPKAKTWTLYKWTKKPTVEDGALVGAALGLAVSIPTLFARRLPIPRWSQCFGLVNTGACTGILGAHAYFQYTGDRQKAYKRLDRRLRKRSLEFWAIFWDKELMARLDPLMQHYVRHQGVWYTQLLPDDVFQEAGELDRGRMKSKKPSEIGQTLATQQPEPPFYTQPFDYAEDLKRITVDSTLEGIKEMEVQKKELLDEAEYLLFFNAQQKYDYCHHVGSMDQDERRRRLNEILLVDIAWNRLRHAADTITLRLTQWRLSLQHKAAWEASNSGGDHVDEWLPMPDRIDFVSHKPTLSVQEVAKMQGEIDLEVRTFERLYTDQRLPKERREQRRQDAEDGRVILTAADHILFRLEEARNAVERFEKNTGGKESDVAASQSAIEPTPIGTTGSRAKAAIPVMKKFEKSQVNGGKVMDPPDGRLEPKQP